MNFDKYKLTIWITFPRAFITLAVLIAIALMLPYLLCAKAEPKPAPVKKVESWSSSRYHFVTMWSDTDEQYTMICDRHTGIESLLAKAYRYPKLYSRSGGVITAMAPIHMGFNPDCLNRDIYTYDRRGNDRR